MSSHTRIASLLVAAAVVAGACVSDPAPPPVDGVDAGTPDARTPRPGDTRLAFEFTPVQAIPGPFPGSFAPTVDEIKFKLADVRAIGDSAPGSDDTRVDAFEIQWNDDGDVAALAFDAAPPGVYSALKATVLSYEISGTVVIDGAIEEFEIEDDAPGDLTIPMIVRLAPNDSDAIAVWFDGDELLTGIDWEQASVEDDKRILDDDELASVSSYLVADAFTADADPDVAGGEL